LVNVDETYGQDRSGVVADFVVICHQKTTRQRGADE
jgi:hypothetical protein